MYVTLFQILERHRSPIMTLSKNTTLALLAQQLGNIHRHGHGVAKSNKKARQWYEKAAEQGHAMAQLNLGLLYCHGRGVQKDYVRF
jgi:TPR repeat protein